ncbi:MAG: 3-oxo-tetronate kinase [Lentilitoribacter sp.]
MLFGAIGDDFTGSSDLGLMLADGGMRTVQYVGTPNVPASSDVDAGIVALKTRSVPVQEAIEKSIEAYRWLKAQGCQQFMFKYCSTFDSTADGNIGQVIDALVDEIGTDKPVVVCPVFPGAGRSIYQGHLFVNDTLLSESGMQNHPLTPMTDPDIRRVLAPQTTRKVGHLPLADILSGNARSHLTNEANQGHQLVVCDAVSEENLYDIAKAVSDFPLITGGSGIALGIPANFGKTSANKAEWSKSTKRVLCLSGSCSVATRGQIKTHIDAGGASLKLDADAVISGHVDARQALKWASEQTTLPLIYSSDDPEQVKAVQNKHGLETAASAFENLFSEIARQASDYGFGAIISAGGETSGAVVEALSADALEIGPMIDPGVPAIKVTGQDLVLALKSGNFGTPDFFEKAAKVLSN